MADNVVHTTNDTQHEHLQAPSPLPTPLDKGEPPSQWASSTIDALAPVPSGPHPVDKPLGEMAAVSSTYNAPTFPSSTATTPGSEFPGAFPRGHGQYQPGVTTQDVKDAATSALETAKGYVVSAGEKVGGYLPGSVAAYLPQSQQTDTNGADTVAPKSSDGLLTDSDAHEFTPPIDRKPSDNTLVQSESETMRDNDSDDGIKSGATFGTSSQQPADNLEEPTTDASTRSLVGSRVDTWSRTATPGASSMLAEDSVNGSTDSNMRNGDGTMKTSSSASVEAQAAHSNQNLDRPLHLGETDPERPDLQHHAEETRNVPSDSSPPDPATTPNAKTPSPTHYDLPNTTGREYPSSSAEDKTLREGVRPDSLKGFVHDSIDSNVATPGHGPVETMEEKGKGKEAADVGVLPSTHAVNAAGNTKSETSTSPAPVGTTVASNATGDMPKTATQAGDEAPLGIGPTPPSHAKADADADPKAKPAKTKSGFMDKLRGEMKVLSGKLEHDQEKVDEGRRMMGKTTTGSKN